MDIVNCLRFGVHLIFELY